MVINVVETIISSNTNRKKLILTCSDTDTIRTETNKSCIHIGNIIPVHKYTSF